MPFSTTPTPTHRYLPSGPGGAPVNPWKTPDPAPAQPAAPALPKDELSPWQKKEVGDLASDPYLKGFLSHDTNVDGLLSGNEVTDAFKAFDADGDGEVNAKEYLAGEAKQAFDARDENQDGELTGTEKNRVWPAWREATDANRDGAIDRKEFQAFRHGMREVGYNGDQNKDGYLTGAEIKPAAQKYAHTDAQGRSLLTRESYIQQKLGELRRR